MIHVIFVPGMFGSMIEHVLRAHTIEGDGVSAEIRNDGSMHTFKKQLHIADWNFSVDNLPTDAWITTPIYPTNELHLPEVLKKLKNFSSSWDTDKKILIYADSVESAERNMLFQYYKIAIGLGMGLDIFASINKHSVKNWNPFYQSWHDMQTWELREWFSLFYPGWISEWMNSVDKVDNSFLTISNSSIMDNPVDALLTIMSFCNLTAKNKFAFFDFLKKYRSAQQYIIDEYNLTKDIVNAVLENRTMSWAPLNIISESIIQQRLREKGHEIKCDGLDVFPTDSNTLYNLLDSSVIHR